MIMLAIRYDYTPGYNTIAKLDLYEYDPSSSFTDYIKSYSLAPGVNRDLALEDADFRLHPSGDFKGFRLDVIPLQSRAGEESPFNFYSGESYFFRIDRRTSDTTFGGFFVENMVQSQFFLDNFQGSDWVRKHGQVFFKINADEDQGGFDTYDYYYDFTSVADLTDPFVDKPLLPISQRIGDLEILAANKAGGTRLIFDVQFDFQTPNNTPPTFHPFDFVATPDSAAPYDLDNENPINQLNTGVPYRLRSSGDFGTSGVWWSTIPYYMIDGVKYLPNFHHYESAGKIHIEYSFTIPSSESTKTINIYLSNPVPDLGGLPENAEIPNSSLVLSDVLDVP
jgi:hypothetical protein